MFENPHGVPLDEIVSLILDNPADVVAQVVFGKYVETGGLVFSGEIVQMMIDRSIPVITSNSWMDEEVAKQSLDIAATYKGDYGQRFFTGVDFGRKTDFTVIKTIDTLTMPARQVYYRRLNRVPWDTIYSEVGRVRAIFGPNILVDSTGPAGDVQMEALDSRLYCPKHHRVILVDTPQCMTRSGKPLDCSLRDYMALSCCDGYVFSEKSKYALLDHLRIIMSKGYDASKPSEPFGWIRTPPIGQLEEELSFYLWQDKGLETDCLFALALAVWAGLEEPVAPADPGSVYGT